jgi:hypothetical protein
MRNTGAVTGAGKKKAVTFFYVTASFSSSERRA